MSVLSRALCFAVLTGIVAGCAVAPQKSSDQSAEHLDGSQNGYGDTAIEAVNEPSSTQAAVEQTAIEREQLADASNAGLDIQLERGTGFTRIIIDTGSNPELSVQTLDGPPRLVVDLLGEHGSGSQAFYLEQDPFISSVRLGVHDDKTRLVFDMTDFAADTAAADHMIDTQNGQVLITFQSVGTDASQIARLEQQEEIASPQLPTIEENTGNEELAAKAEDVELIVDAVQFDKSGDTAGEVTIVLTEEAAYELKQTAPSEYVLSIPGATAATRTQLPQIAPAGFPGVRSARATQQGNIAQVRMFVDPGVQLLARPSGRKIIIQAQASQIAKNPDARAQLGDEGAGGEAPVVEDETARVNPTGVASDDGTKIYTGRLISLDLQDTDIDNALRIIAEVSNLNIIASDDVTGKVTLRLIDVPWDQALDVILKTNGLDQVTEGNVIRIAPVEKLRQEREARREALKALENLEELKVKYIRVSYARVTDMQEQVEGVLSERGSVTADERTNQLIVKDIKKGQDSSAELVSRLDLRTPQVLLETQIVEGERNILRELGFQWNYSYIQSPETGNATGLNFPNSVAIGGANSGQLVDFPAVGVVAGSGSAIGIALDSADGTRSLTARLSAYEEDGKVKVISKPQIATVNNKQAMISSVETVRVRLPDSGTSVATGAGASASGGGATAFEEIEVGIELTVTPQASPDYFVLMDINAKSSTFGPREVDGIPSTIDREATSTILVKSGQTFALGGVYRIEDTDNVQGVPFLKDIPFFGHAFRRTRILKGDEELIFFITPHIVEGSFDPSLM